MSAGNDYETLYWQKSLLQLDIMHSQNATSIKEKHIK